jgi:hypothetical protein
VERLICLALDLVQGHHLGLLHRRRCLLPLAGQAKTTRAASFS